MPESRSRPAPDPRGRSRIRPWARSPPCTRRRSAAVPGRGRGRSGSCGRPIEARLPVGQGGEDVFDHEALPRLAVAGMAQKLPGWSYRTGAVPEWRRRGRRRVSLRPRNGAGVGRNPAYCKSNFQFAGLEAGGGPSSRAADRFLARQTVVARGRPFSGRRCRLCSGKVPARLRAQELVLDVPGPPCILW